MAASGPLKVLLWLCEHPPPPSQGRANIVPDEYQYLPDAPRERVLAICTHIQEQRLMWLIVFGDWGRIAVPNTRTVLCWLPVRREDIDTERRPSISSGSCRENWHLGVDRTGTGYTVSVEGSVLKHCGYLTEQSCPHGFLLH